MRRPRRRAPNQFLDITIRAHHSEFRFLPTPERTNILGFWLSKAQKKYPGVLVAAIAQMSNHIHMVVHDRHGEISRFLQHALGYAAKCINRIDRVRGAVFERRFAEIVVLDEDAFVERIVHAIANPVEANLVQSHRDWTGLCLFAGREPVKHRFTIFHYGRYERASADAKRTRKHVDKRQFFESAELEVASFGIQFAKHVASAIEERELEIRASRPGFIGMQRILRGSPFKRTTMSKRSRMPLCFASTRETRELFVQGWCAFVSAFRDASARFCTGFLDTPFPLYSFRPSTATG